MKTAASKIPWGKILLYVSGLLVLLFCINRARKGSDFEVYLSAGKAILSQQNLYDDNNTLHVQYFYSPLFALLLAPLMYLPAFWVKLVWLLLSVFFMYRIWQLVQSYLNTQLLTSRLRVMWVILSHAVLAGFIIDNFHMVQVTFFMLWATLESVHLVWRGKWVKGALLLALAINIKVLPVLFIPYLFYRSQWRAGLLCMAAVIAFIFLPYLFLSADYHTYLLQQWWLTINPANAGHTLELDPHTFDLPSLVAALLTTPYGRLKVSMETILQTLTAARVFFILLTLCFLRTLPFREAPSPAHQLREVAYLLLVTILLFPHQNKYANVYLLPAFAYTFYYLMAAYNQNKRIFRSSIRFQLVLVLLAASILCLIMTGSSIAGETLYAFLSRVKSITWGTILLTPVLSLLPPAVLAKKEALVPPPTLPL